MRTIFPAQEQITRYGRLRGENVVNFFKGVLENDELWKSLEGKNVFYVLESAVKAWRLDNVPSG